MSTIQTWSPTAASNTSVDGIDIAENCSPANLNNAQRSVMANVAALRDLIGGKAVTGGSANAHTLTSGLTLTVYAQGLLIGFEAGYTNTGATTLNVDSVGAKSVKTPTGAALSAGMMTAGGIYLVAYEAGADAFILIGAAPTIPAWVSSASANGQSLVTAADYAAMRVLLSVYTAAAVDALIAATLAASQPLDADLTAIAAVATQAYGRGLLAYADEAALKAGVNLEAGTDLVAPQTGLAGVMPVGWSGFMNYTSNTALNDGDTTPGTNVKTVVAHGSGFSAGTGTPQTGTWRNVSGSILDANGSEQFGHMVRES